MRSELGGGGGLGAGFHRILEELLYQDCERLDQADEWEGCYAIGEGVVKCVVDIPAYPKGV